MKAGRNESGSQGYRCGMCQRRYTSEPKEHDYPSEICQQAVKLYSDGVNYRRIGRELGVDPVTVMRWVKAHVDQLPSTSPQLNEVGVIELDELLAFVGKKKRSRYHHLVDRHTSCIVAWSVDGTQLRGLASLCKVLLPRPVCHLSRPAISTRDSYPVPDKSETYRADEENAELRHYLAHLPRNSRCFLRYIAALQRAIKVELLSTEPSGLSQ